MKRLPTPRLAFLAAALLAATGCGDDDGPDAYGNFEATETTVSAQADGRLLAFTAREGDALAPGDVVGLVDTTQLAAQRQGLLAQRRQLLGQKRSLLAQARATRAAGDAALAQRQVALVTGDATLAGVAEAQAGVRVVADQLDTAREELARTQRLHADRAATARELNEREGAVAALADQLAQAQARVGSIRAQAGTSGAQARVQTVQARIQQVQAGVPEAQAAAIDDQVAGIDAQLAGIDDRIANAAVVNPTGGTVLTVLTEPGETVATGSPLYTVADLASLKLRAYATGDQLPGLRLGMPVAVFVDDGAGGLRELRGEVTQIASQAQFTPTPIQTRDSRAELVYGFDVRVPNRDGLLKVGMPGEVRFLTTPAE